MRRTYGLATAMMAVLSFGSLAMANTPKTNTSKTSPPQAAMAKKEDTAQAAKSRTARHTRGRKHHRRTVARHAKANMKSSTTTAATRKS
ncbi:MAG: hypothetical protein H0W76_11855 [Pyrinomonadaceae bacterium]|nr:hypothetical protein [Pyrinomonadaceae bacterium]